MESITYFTRDGEPLSGKGFDPLKDERVAYQMRGPQADERAKAWHYARQLEADTLQKVKQASKPANKAHSGPDGTKESGKGAGFAFVEPVESPEPTAPDDQDAAKAPEGE